MISRVPKTVTGARACRGWRSRLPVGSVTSLRRPLSSVCCVSSVGRPLFTLALLQCQSGTSMHATVGGVGIHGEQGFAFACSTKTHYPAWCPPPSPIHPLSPLKTLSQTHPTLPVPPCRLLLFQLIRSMHGGTMGILSTRNLECV